MVYPKLALTVLLLAPVLAAIAVVSWVSGVEVWDEAGE